MTGIYMIKNLINGKCYIGQSINIKRRFKEHKSRILQKSCKEYNSSLYQDIRKFGLQNFSFEVLEECSKEYLNEREIFWISYYNANSPFFGYNLLEGGATTFFKNSRVLSEEEVEEIKKLLRKNISQTEIARLFNVNQGTISDINVGDSWFSSDENYPIRKKQDYYQNIRNKHFCPFCGKLITSKANVCRECAGKNRRVVERPSREILKKEIFKFSFLEIGRKYGVSDNAVRKWCKEYNLPYKKSDIIKFTKDEWKDL